MKYEEYKEIYGKSDHILIRLTDDCDKCYFKDKIIVEDGVEHIETNYHIADGMTSTYINYELPNGNGISAEISSIPRFEICRGKQWSPVFITNAGEEAIDVIVDLHFELEPYEVIAIFPKDLTDEIQEKHDKYIEKMIVNPAKSLGQAEINKLLNGHI